MEKVFIVLAAGFAAGYLLKDNPKIEKVSVVLVDIFLFLLVLALGYSLGQNEEIIRSLASLGLDSVLITAASMAGSILFVLPLHYWTGDRKI
jgi:uncharacterized membrane protein YbjE (DUF340 family)